MYDIIIIGAGPAGLTAALYALQARKKVLIIEKNTYGGQILNALKVKNYPTIEEISGIEFTERLSNQVEKLSPDIKFEEVISISNNEVRTKDNTYRAKAIIIATGAKNRKLGIEGEDSFIGKGISYCTSCDGMFFKDKVVAVTGGGNSAIDGALYLSDICKKVYIIYRRSNFNSESINLELLKKKKNIEFIFDSNVIKVIGDNSLKEIVISTNKEERTLELDGLFIEIGHIPVSNIFNNLIDIDENGYIISNEDCTTNINGVFVAGDIRKKKIRQLTTACSDGTVAAINACNYINKKDL